ncbi:unnamed protein product [Boreogadus saida]
MSGEKIGRLVKYCTGNPLDSYLFHCYKKNSGANSGVFVVISMREKYKLWLVNGLKCVRLESFNIMAESSVEVIINRFHGVMVSTQDSESCDPSSNLGGT